MRRFFIAVLFYAGLLPSALAQTAPVSVIVYKKDTAFTCITLDNTGNVFAGTNGKGICKFDKKTWKNWNPLGTAFIRSNLRQLTCVGQFVWVASSGYVLYLGSSDAGNNNNFWGGVHKINQRLPLVNTYYRGRNVLGQQSIFAQGPPSRNILGVCADNTGRVWCAASYHDSMTYPASLNYNARYHFAPGAVGRFNGANFDFLTGTDLPDPTGILIGVGNDYKDENYSFGKRRTCRSITQVGNEMWVGSDGYARDASTIITAGILRYSLSGTYIGKYDQSNTGVPFGTGNADFGPWALHKDAQGRVWAAMNGNKGLAVFDNTGWHYIGVPSVLPSSTIFRANAIAGNATGQVFFGTGSGLLMYKGSGAYTDAASYTLYTTAQGMSSNSIFGVAVDNDQSIWVATTAGINKIVQGDLLVYSRKPNGDIVTYNETQRTPVINYNSRKTQQQIDNDTLLISADGGRGAIFKWIGSSTNNVKFQFAEDPTGANPDEFGSFSVRHQNADSIRVLYTHPRFVPENFTGVGVGGRNVRLQVVDTTVTPASVLLDIPVRFVLPPVLMIHGVWSSVESFKLMREALLNSSHNYQPFSLLRIWYPNDQHPEPVASQFAYRYEVPNGISQLVENCAANRMAVGKVDILAHSRGGIFSRLYLQSNFVNYRNDINKLITLNTPHSGSQQANLILDKRTVLSIKRVPYPPYYIPTTTTLGKLVGGFVLTKWDDENGAIELKVNSPAILNELNGAGKLNRNTTYSHAVIGRQQFGATTFAQFMSAGLAQGKPALSFRLWAAITGAATTTMDYELQKIFDTEYNDIVVPESSQKGGLAEAYVSRFPGLNVAHSNKNLGPLPLATGVLEIPQVHTRMLELLRAKPTGGLFTTGGFQPPVLHYTYLQPNPLYLSGTVERTMGTAQTDFSITIDTALNGKTFAAGDTVTVKISKNNTDTVVVAYSGTSIDVYSDVHFGNDTVFRFPVPREAIGAISIQAYAFNNHQMAYDSSTITIGLPTGVTLDSIRIRRPDATEPLMVMQGDSLTVQMNGYYSDNIVRDITYQPALSYSLVVGNAGVALPNKLKGLTVGFDQLIAVYQGKSDTAGAEVVARVTLPATVLAPLPVSFLGITARYTSNAVAVSWGTSQEINNNRFEVEHSITGADFTTVGVVRATNNTYGSSYSFAHLNYSTGNNYYRIKQVDNDGKVSYSSVASVFVSAKTLVSIYPNPVAEKLAISFNDPGNTVRMLRIVNLAGQAVYERSLNAGTTTVSIAVGRLASGVYSVLFYNKENENVNATTFVKQ